MSTSGRRSTGYLHNLGGVRRQPPHPLELGVLAQNLFQVARGARVMLGVFGERLQRHLAGRLHSLSATSSVAPDERPQIGAPVGAASALIERGDFLRRQPNRDARHLRHCRQTLLGRPDFRGRVRSPGEGSARRPLSDGPGGARSADERRSVFRLDRLGSWSARSTSVALRMRRP